MSTDSKVMQVIQFTGCSEEQAISALEQCDQDVLTAVDTLVRPPTVSGSKYVGSVNTVVSTGSHLDPAVRENIEKARKLADLFTFAPQNDLRGKASHYPSSAPEHTQEVAVQPAST